MPLSSLRQTIDSLDCEIIKLLARRQNLADEIASLKKSSGQKIFDPRREREILTRLQTLARAQGLSPALTRKIFQEIMRSSRERQKETFDLIDSIAPRQLQAHKKKLPLNLSELEIFKRLYREFDDVFFLESLGADPHFARYSFLGFNPRTKIVARGNELLVGNKKFPTANPYLALEKFLPRVATPWPGFAGGLVGYLTYEATRYFEDALTFPTHPDFPDLEFGLFLDGIIFNKITGETEYFWFDEDRSPALLKILKRPAPKNGQPFRAKFLGCNLSRRAFEQKVELAKKEIVAGNIFQVQVGRKYFFELSGDRLQFYENLRRVNPSPQMFYLKFGERELIGSSPELIIRVEKGVVENFPLAGTRKRGATTEEDNRLAAQLLNDEKERAEHLMLVDLGRNDVGRVCQFGSVHPRELMAVKKFPHIQHLGSEIVGQLQNNLTAFSALAANTPVGTVSGAPKVEAMKIIQRLEKDPRGPYAGAVGYFSFNGDCNFAAGLRSLFAHGKKAFVQASAGIVHDSVPEYEFGEVEKKVGSVIRALKI